MTLANVAGKHAGRPAASLAGAPEVATLPVLPTGTVTFLFTDIEDSTRLLQQAGDEGFARVLDDHQRLLGQAVAAHGGEVVGERGDGFLFVFRRARDAVLAAVEAQRALAAHAWPPGAAVRVRMGLHTGEPLVGEGGYVGLDVHRVARICEAGWGGQILLSQTTRELVALDLPPGLELRDLGRYRLRGVQRPEPLYQVVHPALPAEFPRLRTLETLPNNLPRQLTSFIGREQEMADVARLLEAHRLVTLTGIGGCGKTRLAIELAATVVEAYRDGVWLVELGTLADPAHVPQAAATVLGVREQPGAPLSDTLARAVADRELLLVLDNCEHVVAAAAALAEALLRRAPRVRILATSRERLAAPGEATYRLQPLTLPDLHRPENGDRLASADAVRLFVDRAQAAAAGFALSRASARVVAEICHRLDGIPLAIELAAARTGTLTVEQIAARLGDRFRLLTGGSRTAVSRHQTLRAAMEWSYALLSDQERVLFARLAGFAGAWTLEAAEAVCGFAPLAPDAVLDLIAQLHDKSLVAADHRDGETRYRFLDTVRQFAQEKLAASGEAETVRARHRRWFLALAERAEPELTGAAQRAWLTRLDADHENFRAALQDALEHGGGEALRLASALGRFWWIRGHLSEARRWLEGAIDRDPDAEPLVRARGLLEAGRLAYTQSDHPAAHALFEQSLAVYRERRNPTGIADALNMLGLVAWASSNYADAEDRFREALGIARELRDQRRVAVLLGNLGLVAQTVGDNAGARALHQESLDLLKGLDNTLGIASALNNLGLAAAYEARYAEARALLEESLRHRRALGDRHTILYSLNNLALVAHWEGDQERAADLGEESLALARELGDTEGIANALLTLARVALSRADLGRAERLVRESLELRVRLGDRRGIAECLEQRALLAHAQGDHARTCWFHGAALALRASTRAAAAAADQDAQRRAVAGATAALGPEAARLTDDGRAAALDDAIRRALAGGPDVRAGAPAEPTTGPVSS